MKYVTALAPLLLLLALTGCFLFKATHTIEGVSYAYPRSYAIAEQGLEPGFDDVERPTVRHKDGASAIGVIVAKHGELQSVVDLASTLRTKYRSSKYARDAIFSDVTPQVYVGKNRKVPGARFTQTNEILGLAVEVAFHIYVVQGATKEVMVLFVTGAGDVIDDDHDLAQVLRTLVVP